MKNNNPNTNYPIYLDYINSYNKEDLSQIKVKSIKPGDLIQCGNIPKRVIKVLPYDKKNTKIIFENNCIRIWTNTNWVVKHNRIEE